MNHYLKNGIRSFINYYFFKTTRNYVPLILNLDPRRILHFMDSAYGYDLIPGSYDTFKFLAENSTKVG